MNLGGMEAIAQQVAGKAILDHAQETERKLVSPCVHAVQTRSSGMLNDTALGFVLAILNFTRKQ